MDTDGIYCCPQCARIMPIEHVSRNFVVTYRCESRNFVVTYRCERCDQRLIVDRRSVPAIPDLLR
jgi:hypothetical protein